MTHHKVKSWSYLFNALISGQKKHDIRDMRDRDYKVNDLMTLQEFDQTTGKYTGREHDVRITYITNRNTACAFSSAVLDRNFAILSVELIGAVRDCNVTFISQPLLQVDVPFSIPMGGQHMMVIPK